MASEISWFHLPKILFSSLQLKLIGTAQRLAQKDAKHKKLLNLLCIVYNKNNLPEGLNTTYYFICYFPIIPFSQKQEMHQRIKCFEFRLGQKS